MEASRLFLGLGVMASSSSLAMMRPSVFIEVSSCGTLLGRMVVELRCDDVQDIAEGFRARCVRGGAEGYAGKSVEGVERGVAVRFCGGGGDDDNKNHNDERGAEGDAVRKAGDDVKHDKAGLLSTCVASGVNTPSFLVTLAACPHLDEDGTHVVFGKVVEGMHLLTKLERLATENHGIRGDVRISASGELDIMPVSGTRLPARTKAGEELRTGDGALPLFGATADGSDPTAGMSAMEKRLYELQMKVQKSKYANKKAVVAERRRRYAPTTDTAADGQQEKEGGGPPRRKDDEKASGENTTLMHQSQEEAEQMYKRKKKKERTIATAGTMPTDIDVQYASIQKRADAIPVNLDEYERAKHADPEFYRDGNSMLYGQAPKIPQQNIDRMVKELDEQRERRSKFSRRRKHYEGRDVDSINERNTIYNQSIAKAFDKYTVEIKTNLERGTALPER